MPEEGPHGTTGTMKSHTPKDNKLYTNSLYTLSLYTLRVYPKERTLVSKKVYSLQILPTIRIRSGNFSMVG